MYSLNLNNKLYVLVAANMDNYHHRGSYPFTVRFILILGIWFRSRRMMVHVYWSDRACRKGEDHSLHHIGKARRREKARTTWLCKLLQVRKAPEAGTGQPALPQCPWAAGIILEGNKTIRWCLVTHQNQRVSHPQGATPQSVSKSLSVWGFCEDWLTPPSKSLPWSFHSPWCTHDLEVSWID